MVWQPSYDTAAALLRNLGKQDATTKQNRKSPLREEACGETLLPRFKATGEPTVAQAQLEERRPPLQTLQLRK